MEHFRKHRISRGRALLAACLGACALGLFACGSGSTKNEPLVFAVGGVPAELDVWEKVIADFTRATGRKVELLRQPADSDQRRQGLAVALQAHRSQPDVFLMDVAWIAQFAASGWLAPMGKADGSDSLPDPGSFPAGVRAVDLLDGKPMAMPVYVDAGLLYYRKDLLEKYGFTGPPETWEEMQAMSRKVQAGERKPDPYFYGYVWQGAQYEGLVCNFLEVASSAGGGFAGKDGGFQVDSEPNRRALELMAGMVGEQGISPPETFTGMKEEEVRRYFQKGSALFERNWPYAWALHQAGDSPVRGKVGIAPLPHFPGHKPAATLGGWHVGISAYSEKRADAMSLVRYILSVPVQKRLALELGWNPARKEVYGDPDVLARLPHFKALGEVFSYAVPRPNLPYWSQLSEVLQRGLNAALAGKTRPEAALRQAQDEASAIVRRYRGE